MLKRRWIAYDFSDARWGRVDFDAAVDHCWMSMEWLVITEKGGRRSWVSRGYKMLIELAKLSCLD